MINSGIAINLFLAIQEVSWGVEPVLDQNFINNNFLKSFAGAPLSY